MNLEWIVGPVLIAVLLAAVVTWLRRMLNPRLLIGDAAGEPKAIAAYLPDLIADELDLLRSEGGGTSLQMASGPDVPIALPETSIAPDIPKLLNWLLALLPRPTIVFNLRLIASGVEDRPGLVVALHAGGQQHATAVLWDHDYGPATKRPAAGPPPRLPPPSDEPAETAEGSSFAADTGKDGAEIPPAAPADDNDGGGDGIPAHKDLVAAFHRLALVASAWLAYQLPTDDPRGRDHALLSTDWRSYAHFRVGAQAEGLEAREPYVRALLNDPRNRGALHNLAVLDGHQHCYALALDRLSATVALLGDEGRERDRLWYRARFNLAVAAVNYVLDVRRNYPIRKECLPSSAANKRGYVAMAIDALSEVETRTVEEIKALERAQELTRQGIRSNAGLLTFLREMREVAGVVRAGAEDLRDDVA